jgi:hypothetical protein
MLAGSDKVANTQLCDSSATEVGITGTPVVDWSTGTLYAVALDVESGRLTYRIHAVDVTTGIERRAPTVITATVVAAWTATTAPSHSPRAGRIQAHTSEVGWEPPNVPALWQLIS